MPYHWKPNRDSGSIRSHRNPNTRRRYARSEIGQMFKAHNGRAAMNAAMHAAMPLLKTGLYDVSIKRTRRGWDAGDPLSSSVIAVEVGDYISWSGKPDFFEEEYPPFDHFDLIDLYDPWCDACNSYRCEMS